MNAQPDHSPGIDKVGVLITVIIAGVTSYLGLEVMTTFAETQPTAEDFDTVCNGFSGCAGQPLFAGGIVDVLLVVVVLAVIVCFLSGTMSLQQSDDSTSGVTLVQEQYVNGDIETVLELESRLEDALDGNDGGVRDD